MSKNEKGIIIDGIDVSECSLSLYDHYDNSICLGFDGGYNVFCSDNPDCYYKQLQRLKAEYKKFSEYLPIAARLAKQFKTFEEAKGIDYDGILSEWLAENEELKNTLKELREQKMKNEIHKRNIELYLEQIEELKKQRKELNDISNYYQNLYERTNKEFEQYKKSKQASYESMQNEWNKAVKENRYLRENIEVIIKEITEILKKIRGAK